jgi:hippurate hydrolase
MEEIITGTASLFRANATLTFTSGCPTLVNDQNLSKNVTKYMKELLGPEKAFTVGQLQSMSGNLKSAKATGSEDFAYFSHEVPSIMLSLAGGEATDGYTYPLHHPKVTFDETALPIGSAVYAYNAIRWLEEHA